METSPLETRSHSLGDTRGREKNLSCGSSTPPSDRWNSHRRRRFHGNSEAGQVRLDRGSLVFPPVLKTSFSFFSTVHRQPTAKRTTPPPPLPPQHINVTWQTTNIMLVEVHGTTGFKGESGIGLNMAGITGEYMRTLKGHITLSWQVKTSLMANARRQERTADRSPHHWAWEWNLKVKSQLFKLGVSLSIPLEHKCSVLSTQLVSTSASVSRIKAAGNVVLS